MLFRELNVSDIHIPYHDPYAWELFLNIVEVVKPTTINILGDALDCPHVSTFDKDPEIFSNGGFQENLDQWFRMMLQLKRRAIGSKIRYLPGNHEDRLYKWLMRNPGLYGLRALELESLLRLEELGIEYYPEEIEIIPGKLVGKHGDLVRGFSAFSAKGELEKEKHSLSTLTGHTHRLGTYYVTTRRGIIKAHENGCLCQLRPKYIRGIPNWQQGLTETHHNGGDLFHTEDIPFFNEDEHIKAVVQGNVVTL